MLIKFFFKFVFYLNISFLFFSQAVLADFLSIKTKDSILF